MVDINIFIMHYVLTTVLDRLDVIDNFFWVLHIQNIFLKK